MSNPVQLSKTVSRVLRHAPESIGLTLDAAGWCPLDELVARMAAAGLPATREQVLAVVAANDKQRFALSSDGRRIRANQGHSVAVDLGLTPCPPPARLYHGTAERFLPAIEREGLQRRARHHVHLSEQADTARRVGQRHGRAVVLEIDAQRMADEGAVFWRTANGVWLVDTVPWRHVIRTDRPAPPGG